MKLRDFFNKNKRKIICFFLINFFLIIFSIIVPITCDEIWNFGFSYNISKGLIPYKDFNMVILPFYQLLTSFILFIFGRKIIVFNICLSMLFSYILIKTNSYNLKNSFYLLANIVVIQIGGGAIFGYNTFITMLLILIIYLENGDYKYKNQLIGLIIGSILMTKINLGIFIMIPYFIFSKHKIKSIIFMSIIPIIILIYLFITNSYLECFDYCFLGLNNFKNNFNFSIISLIFIEIFVITYIIYKYIISKDKIYIYLLFFQGTLYPVFDLHHFAIVLLPIFYYIMTKNVKIIKGYKILSLCLLFFLFYISVINFNLYKKNNFLLLRNASRGEIKFLEEQNKFIKNNKNEKKYYFFTGSAYYIKMYAKEKITKYDLINKGNMGSNELKNLEEIDTNCQSHKCLFLIDEDEFKVKNTQLNKKYLEYVINNYKKCDYNNNYYEVYCNF